MEAVELLVGAQADNNNPPRAAAANKSRSLRRALIESVDLF